ncbi:MAG: YicC/YloC family endoribonuclease [Treponemataceae bacterium]
MNSMTGCAFEEFSTDTETICVEIKSYNSKYLDINIVLPTFLSRYENIFREKIQNTVKRGKLDVYIKLQEKYSNISLAADTKVAKKYAEAVKNLAKELKVSYNKEILPFLLRQNEIFIKNVDRNCDAYCEKVLNVLENTLVKLNNDRLREGQNLLHDINNMLAKLNECITFFEDFLPKMKTFFQDQIEKKMHDLLEQNIDKQRLMQEIAFLVVKHTINEEVVRLRSHVQSLEYELATNPCPGRKIDFICQEINREINTIGSKNQCIELTPYIISIKDALENIREQGRNIE